ncbi:MAG TPA: hypothetical protein VFL41_05665 [Gaiellaceae bacterium]|nr:hypothetical protein [Gaiellaceae bacterium]
MTGSAILHVMDISPGLTNTVQFEVPDLAAAARLATMLRPRWTVVVTESGDVALVNVHILSSGRLALLLRAAEDWVARESLCAIRFELDGRGYVLASGDADWTAAPWAAAAA